MSGEQNDNGKQCTLIWHVDNIKGSHMEETVLINIATDKFNYKYGQEMPLTIHCSKGSCSMHEDEGRKDVIDVLKEL
jgi:hypothetical protein